jgi:hypothetical protein
MRILVLLLCGVGWRLFAYELQLGLGNQPQRETRSVALIVPVFFVSPISPMHYKR